MNSRALTFLFLFVFALSSNNLVSQTTVVKRDPKIDSGNITLPGGRKIKLSSLRRNVQTGNISVEEWDTYEKGMLQTTFEGLARNNSLLEVLDLNSEQKREVEDLSNSYEKFITRKQEALVKSLQEYYKTTDFSNIDVENMEVIPARRYADYKKSVISRYDSGKAKLKAVLGAEKWQVLLRESRKSLLASKLGQESLTRPLLLAAKLNLSDAEYEKVWQATAKATRDLSDSLKKIRERATEELLKSSTLEDHSDIRSTIQLFGELNVAREKK